MTDQTSIENKLLALKLKYIQSLPEKLDAITTLWQTYGEKMSEQITINDKSLESALHKLAGSAGMYEEDELGQIARDIELTIAGSGETINASNQQKIIAGLKRLEEKIRQLTT